MFVWMNRRLKLNYLFSIYSLCRDTFCRPSPIMYGRLVQWTQYNKFVESGLKNKALMSWTTADIELDDNQIRIRDVDMNELRYLSYKSITAEYKYNFDCYSILSFFLRSPAHGGSLILYSSLCTILTYTCWLFETLLEYPSHQTPSLAFCELW